LITHLELDVSVLVQDVGSIRDIFNQIKDDLPSSLKGMIQPAAFLEGNDPKFLSAQSTLADREAKKTQLLVKANASKKSYQLRK